MSALSLVADKVEAQVNTPFAAAAVAAAAAAVVAAVAAAAVSAAAAGVRVDNWLPIFEAPNRIIKTNKA